MHLQSLCCKHKTSQSKNCITLLHVKFHLAVHISKRFLPTGAYIHIINSLSTTFRFASQQPPGSKPGLECNSHFPEDSSLFRNKACGLTGALSSGHPLTGVRRGNRKVAARKLGWLQSLGPQLWGLRIGGTGSRRQRERQGGVPLARGPGIFEGMGTRRGGELGLGAKTKGLGSTNWQ